MVLQPIAQGTDCTGFIPDFAMVAINTVDYLVDTLFQTELQNFVLFYLGCGYQFGQSNLLQEGHRLRLES